MQDSLYRNSFFLIANTFATSVIGFIFWTIAARMYSPSEVGVASAIIAATAFLASISYLGFDYSLIKFIPSSTNIAVRLGTAFTSTGIMSVLVSSVYLLITPLLTHNLEFLVGSFAAVLLFIFLILMTTWNSLTNSALVAFRITQYVAVATAISGIFKIVSVLLLSNYNEYGLIIAHSVAVAVSVILSFVFIRKVSGYSYRPMISKAEIAATAKFSAANYSAAIAGGIALMVLPIIIIKFLSADQAAYFYVVVMVVALLNVISQATTQSLFAEGSWDKETFKRQSLKAAKAIMTILLPSIVVFILLGKLGLSIFGKNYADFGYALLIVLSLSSIPKVINQIISTSLRVHDRTKPIIVITIIGAIITVGVSIALLSLGMSLVSVGFAILISDVAAALMYIYVYFKELINIHNLSFLKKKDINGY